MRSAYSSDLVGKKIEVEGIRLENVTSFVESLQQK
jgi:hypothetical protein